MSTAKRVFAPGTYYHIYNRGTSKQKVYLDYADKNRFLDLLYLCNGVNPFNYKDLTKKRLFDFSFDKGNNLVEICSWVLMDNHFHILIFLPENSPIENISKFVSRLCAAYLKYFNQKYDRSGNLFEGRYKCLSVDDDMYLSYLFSYIHLNPLKMLNNNWKEEGLKIKNAENYLRDYKYSSFQDLIINAKRREGNIISDNLKVLEISKTANKLDKLLSFVSLTPGGRD